MFDIGALMLFMESLGYLGTFLSGFLSSLFIVTLPSFVIVPILSTRLNPVTIGILAGLGVGLGQFLYYYVGAGGRAVLPDKYKLTVEKWRARLGKYGVIAILVYAATSARQTP